MRKEVSSDMEDLAILASIMMAIVLLSGTFALAAAWMDGPRWLVLPVSVLAIALGLWWGSIPTATWMLGPMICFMGVWAFATTMSKDWA
jgi:hypothetical protein